MCNLKFANSGPQELNTPWWGSTLPLSVSLFGTIRNPIGQQREQLLPVRERLGFFEPFCSPNWKGSVAKSLQKMGHWNSCGTILLLHNMNILPLLLGKSWYRECIHCISFHIAAHIISHRILESRRWMVFHFRCGYGLESVMGKFPGLLGRDCGFRAM